MSDIFISYSSKDKEKADQLSELLASAGLSVWIDQHGIDVATSWSKEIVMAIDGCKAFVVLLSPNSVGSVNVAREVSLASEQKKKILPLDLEPVELSEDLRYHLAGIQRTSMMNIDSIIRALGKLGLEETQAPTLKLVKETDSRKSLMILPFEDMSPTGDNGWFADGIVSEMISALSNVKALRVTDAATTREYKSYKGHLTTYAKEMQIRFFVQGDVRKFGDAIKITSRLLDIETGDHLWQDSMKGTMDDIFDIQEKVAEKVVEGLRVHLADDEKKKLVERDTQNSEAYELFVRAQEYFRLQTKEALELSIQLCAEAIKIDPNFLLPYSTKSNSLAQLYRYFDHDPNLLDQALMLVNEALRLKPTFWKVYGPLCSIYQLQGKLKEAEHLAMEFIRNDPDSWGGHYTLAYFYTQTNRFSEAIPEFEKTIKLVPNSMLHYWNIVISCDSAKEVQKRISWALVAIPLYARHLRLFPDDENAQVQLVNLLFLSGRVSEAREKARHLENLRGGIALFELAIFHSSIEDYEIGIKIFRKSIEAGFKGTRHLMQFLTDEKEGIASLAGTPEYEEVKRMVEKIEEEAKSNV